MKKRTVGFEIRTLDNMLMRWLFAVRAQKGSDDFTVMQGWIVGFVYGNKGRDIFQKDIEQEYSISRSTATGILQLMEKKGLLRREPVGYDARLKKLVLTEKAVRLHMDTIKDIDLLEKRLVAGIEKEEMDIFFRVIDKMRENIKDDDMR